MISTMECASILNENKSILEEEMHMNPGGGMIALGIGMCYTLKSRIEELRSGEEDDLNNY